MIGLYQGMASAVPNDLRKNTWALAPEHGETRTLIQRLKPSGKDAFTARLKSCPDTKHRLQTVGDGQAAEESRYEEQRDFRRGPTNHNGQAKMPAQPIE